MGLVMSCTQTSTATRRCFGILMGHRSKRTLKAYGQAQQARGRRNIIVAVKGSHEVRTCEATHLAIKKQIKDDPHKL
ncbi:hypothetical protein BEN30_16060 [Magnetovibrio blakemorei]|uniref:Uncharacterized protein n=1 Tax=Magnetovibrio blakemorei TaxID=28181 RepID=A0A1E5Q572_9PROT|nr:hypothetical protein BEN30_16060 [Magnetovibrio blakemorei]